MIHRDRRHPKPASRSQPAVAKQRRRREMHNVGIESAQHAYHSGHRHAERQRGHLRKHSRRHPMYPDAVVNSVCAGFTRRIVGRDDEGFVTGSTQMLEDAQH